MLTPNLLASGADEGELCIWDLANPSEPNLFPSLKVSMNLRNDFCIDILVILLCITANAFREIHLKKLYFSDLYGCIVLTSDST